MEYREFYTIVRSNHKLSGNNYVFGFIRGIECAMCGIEGMKHARRKSADDEWVIPTVCTEEQYRAFADMVSKIYPCLCEFDQSIVRNEEGCP